MTLTVIDLSHHNTVPQSLKPAAESGVYGVIHKATEGQTYVDSKVQARYYLTKDAGMLWGCYHFLRPGKGADQAKHFIDVMNKLGVLDDNTLLAADHEDPGVKLDQLFEFLETVFLLTGREPVIYSGHVLKEQMDGWTGDLPPYRLWLAQYGPTATLPNGFDKYWLWQYTDKGQVDGITPPTDLNKFDGSFDQLEGEWAGHLIVPPVEEPAPEPPPEEESEIKEVTVTVDIYSPPGVKVNVIVVNPGPEE